MSMQFLRADLRSATDTQAQMDESYRSALQHARKTVSVPSALQKLDPSMA